MSSNSENDVLEILNVFSQLVVHRNSNGEPESAPNDLVDLMTLDKPVIDKFRLVSDSMIQKRGSNADRSGENSIN